MIDAGIMDLKIVRLKKRETIKQGCEQLNGINFYQDQKQSEHGKDYMAKWATNFDYNINMKKIWEAGVNLHCVVI